MNQHAPDESSNTRCEASSCECDDTISVRRRDFFKYTSVAAVTGATIAAGTPESRGQDVADSPALLASKDQASTAARAFNSAYQDEFLDRVAFPIGGIGAGMVCLEGAGALSHVSVRHRPEIFHEPCAFAAVCVKGVGENVAKVLEGPVPSWKSFGQRDAGRGAAGTTYGLPRCTQATFHTAFPFAEIDLRDDDLPLQIKLTGWSPFVPNDEDNSSLPVGAFVYEFKNPTSKPIDAVFSYHTKNFMATGDGNTIVPLTNGFVLRQPGREGRNNDFAIYTDNDQTVVDHCWFRGGWWDSLTLAWRNVQEGRLLANPPSDQDCPGASLYTPIRLGPGQSTTVRLMLAWHVPSSRLQHGQSRDSRFAGPAFGDAPSEGTAADQQEVSNFAGQGLVNTYDPYGDGAIGTLTSPEFVVQSRYIQFLIGGGSHPKRTCMNLLVDDQVVRTQTGSDAERLSWETWDVKNLVGKTARLKIVDDHRGGWGHVNVDHIVMLDEPVATASEAPATAVLQDFESGDYGKWVAEGPDPPAETDSDDLAPSTYVPWYARRFQNIEEVCKYWTQEYSTLLEFSTTFREAFYDSTLPPEVVEAVAANLTILKSPTVLRQHDGKLWAWEGCNDDSGCCAGSCTHVWNYAQAIPHLFPALERSLRETEFNDSQSAEGHQTFRAALPIRPIARSYHAAADGQLGGIMKVYREWRISGDDSWLRRMWPQLKMSLDYCIRTWDPRHRGILEEPHHNTYDIEYWGPEGHCTSFYLGALSAACKMGRRLGHDVSRYANLQQRGREFMEQNLYNGEYFYQKIQTEGLDAKFSPLDASRNGKGYDRVIQDLNKQGPKYQYGTGCLSDGVLGFWIAEVCGVVDDLIDPEKLHSNLRAIHQHNFKPDLSDHANPQRPSYAFGNEGGLLLCTWPRGGALAIPFVYSDEVWTGIEYQVASHLMMKGMVEEGLQIVRACRNRYDGRTRNPFNEYECGHWYARAMASYGLLQGLTGVRYDAVEEALFIDSRVGDNFRGFLSTESGFGVVGLKSGKPFFDERHGSVSIRKVYVSGQESTLA